MFTSLWETAANPFCKLLTVLTECKMNVHEPHHLKSIKSAVKKSIISIENTLYEQWDSEITNNRKLGVFNIVKESYDCEKYINIIDDRFLRKYLSMVRLSCHPLKVETGRYKKIPKHLRICDFCDSHEVEDEYHTLIKCKLYENLRNQFFSDLTATDNEMWDKASSLEEKFIVILQPQDVKSTVLICNYIKSCFLLRKSKQSS